MEKPSQNFNSDGRCQRGGQPFVDFKQSTFTAHWTRFQMAQKPARALKYGSHYARKPYHKEAAVATDTGSNSAAVSPGSSDKCTEAIVDNLIPKEQPARMKTQFRARFSPAVGVVWAARPGTENASCLTPVYLHTQ